MRVLRKRGFGHAARIKENEISRVMELGGFGF
jgi:hypothetical protein